MHFFLILCTLFFSSLYSADDHWIVLETKEYPYSWIVYLMHQETEEEYVLKQIKEQQPEEQVQILMEVLVGEMAEEISIPINIVRLIGIDEWKEIKPLPNCACTLHSRAKGVLIEDSVEWHDLEIGQRIRPPGTAQYQRYGPLPSEKIGFTWDVIREMSRHKDLPPLVALDTFVGNRDRWENNLFYDQETDTFTGIDLGESYKHNLMAEACRQMKVEKNIQNERLEVLQSLESFTTTMEILVKKWPKERILERFVELAKSLRIEVSTSPKSQSYIQTIEESCQAGQPLLQSLNLILNCKPLNNTPYTL